MGRAEMADLARVGGFRDVGVEEVARVAPARSRVMRRYRHLAWGIAVTDALSLVLAMVSAYAIRFGMSPIPPDFVLLLGFAPVLGIASFAAFRAYELQHFSPAEEFRRIIAAVAVAVTALTVVSFWSRASYSRFWVGLTWLLSIVFVLASRQLWHRVVERMRKDGRLRYATLVVGTNEEAARLALAMRGLELGYRAIGCVRTGRDPIQILHLDDQLANGGLPVVGDVSKIRETIQATGADCVFLASSCLSPGETARVARAARLEGAELRISANLPEILATRVSVQPFGDTMAVSLRPVRLTGGQAALKRTFDLVVSAVGLVITLPLWLGIALAIKLSSRGPVFFRQSRVGKQGIPFTLLKFRTMIRGAETLVAELRAQNEADGPLFKIHDDPRVTRLGRWLRKWSIDELPQLWNVVRGQMSLVGPRPCLPEELAQYEDWHHGRLEVAPGITGLWQVNGRSAASFAEYLRRDFFYIENWSLAYDLFIIARTIPAVFGKRGSY